MQKMSNHKVVVVALGLISMQAKKNIEKTDKGSLSFTMYKLRYYPHYATQVANSKLVPFLEGQECIVLKTYIACRADGVVNFFLDNSISLNHEAVLFHVHSPRD